MSRDEVLKGCSYSHDFHDSDIFAQKSVFVAMIFTILMMIAEIVAGWSFGSMALLADGWHMSSHALALFLAFFAYKMATRYKNDTKFNFGTYKIEILGAYTSALTLLGIAVFMAYESIHRLLNPVEISYNQAILVAILGLLVNLICAFMLKNKPHAHFHTHSHSHDCTHAHHSDCDHMHECHVRTDSDRHSDCDRTAHVHEDLNLKAAYIHIITDAFTSILAIFALVLGMKFGWRFLDPIMGVVGAFLIGIWAFELLKQSSEILLDKNMDEPIVDEVIADLQSYGAKIEDLHLIRVSKDKFACIASISSQNTDILALKSALSKHKELTHILIENYE